LPLNFPGGINGLGGVALAIGLVIAGVQMAREKSKKAA